jgi:serine protein kinase
MVYTKGISMEWIEYANEMQTNDNRIMSFFDYFDMFTKNPLQQCRPTFRYFTDMLNSFGYDDQGNHKLFIEDDPDAPAVFGQNAIIDKLIRNLRNFEEEGFNNKFILLVGPNGSSKSSIVKKLMLGAQKYSETEDGALYTFSWIFPINTVVKGTLGLTGSSESRNLDTFANLDDKDISAILTSELKDHPLLLVPLEHRRKIIDEHLADSPEVLEDVRKTYLYRGDLSKRNKMIYDALLKNYKGNHNEVLKHIRVERFEISKRYSSGAVTIEPQLHVDAKLQQITMDKRLASLPPSLQSLNLFSLQGEAVLANRGILEFSDLLKRPLDAFKYLLMTIETGNINLGGILTELDIFFIGTSNEIHMSAFKQHPDFNSFKGRFRFIKVPYLLNYSEEKKIYQNQIDGLKERTVFEPMSLSALCKFAVMTRIRSCMSKHYDNPKLTSIVTGFTPLEKCYLYSTAQKLPKRLDSENKQLLKHNVDTIRSEFNNDNLYEGKFGISPRDMKNVIYGLADEYDNITFIEVLEYLTKLVAKKNEYDFLNMSSHGDFHNPTRFLELIKNDCLDQYDKILRESLGLVDDRSYEDYMRKYIEHINSSIKGEKIKNTVTGKYEEPDSYFIKEFETNIALKEDPKKFRSHLISKLGAWYLDNPGVKIDYHTVFPEVIDRLQESFRNEQKKVIENISKNLVFFEAELADSSKKKNNSLNKEDREQISRTLENLNKKHTYSQNGALKLIKFLIKERY